MKNIYISIAIFIISVSSVFGQSENEKYFLDVNHFEELYWDFLYVEDSDIKTYKGSDKTYLIVDLPLLLNTFIGDKEYAVVTKFGFDSELAYFDTEGAFERINLIKDKANVKSKYELYDILEYLDWRFGSHTYSKGIYTYETTHIKVMAAFDQGGNLIVQSEPKR